MELEGRLSGRGGEEPKKVKDEGRENVAVIHVNFLYYSRALFKRVLNRRHHALAAT